MTRSTLLAVGLAAALTTFPLAASAYIGPGAGISAIGTAFALLGAILFAVVGFVWYPVKRLLKRRRRGVGETHARDRSDT
jgi:hypothetical protein